MVFVTIAAPNSSINGCRGSCWLAPPAGSICTQQEIPNPGVKQQLGQQQCHNQQQQQQPDQRQLLQTAALGSIGAPKASSAAAMAAVVPIHELQLLSSQDPLPNATEKQQCNKQPDHQLLLQQQSRQGAAADAAAVSKAMAATVPIHELLLSPQDPLRTATRKLCPNCNKARAFFCCGCLTPLMQGGLGCIC